MRNLFIPNGNVVMQHITLDTAASIVTSLHAVRITRVAFAWVYLGEKVMLFD